MCKIPREIHPKVNDNKKPFNLIVGHGTDIVILRLLERTNE